MIFNSRIYVFLLFCLGISLAPQSHLHSGVNFISVKGIELTGHDYGLKFAYKNGHAAHRNSFNWIELSAAIMRAVAVPIEHNLVGVKSTEADVTRAIIAFVRFVEEGSYILNHPEDEHAIDLVWASVDAVEIFRHLDKACTPSTQGSADAIAADARQTPSRFVPQGMTPLQASTLLEAACGVIVATVSSHQPHRNDLRRLNFLARSTMSFLRLLRSYYEIPASEENEQNIYKALIGLQAAYTALKLGVATFDIIPPRPPTPPAPAPLPVPFPYPHRDPVPSRPLPVTIAGPHAVRFGTDAAREPVDSCIICTNDFADNTRLAVIRGCGHTYCRDCLHTHLTTQNAYGIPNRRCPECRVHVDQHTGICGVRVNFTNNTLARDPYNGY